MRSISITAVIAAVTLSLATVPTRGDADGTASKAIALPASVDRVVLRGSIEADVSIGPPRLTILTRAGHTPGVDLSRDGTLVTLMATTTMPSEPSPLVSIRIPRLRGLATSGDVVLTVADPSGPPLFLDLSGSTSARVRGFVPEVRITTSGTARVDLLSLVAGSARAHARQRSRLALRGNDRLTIVALDDARVTWAGSARPAIVQRARAIVKKFAERR